MSILSDNINKVLKQKGLTPYQVSLAAGKNKQFVADILNGRARSTSHENLTYLARALNVPVSQLTGEPTEPTLNPDIMLACFGWVLEHAEKLAEIGTVTIVQELKIQFAKMQKDNIADADEAVRITGYLFDSLLAKEKLKLKPPAKRKPPQK